jgi:hypothetical protein
MEAASAGSHRHAGVAAEARRKSSNGGRDELNVHPDAKMGSGQRAVLPASWPTGTRF